MSKQESAYLSNDYTREISLKNCDTTSYVPLMEQMILFVTFAVAECGLVET